MKGAYFKTPAPHPLVPARDLSGSNPVIKPRISSTSKDLRNPAKPSQMQRPSSKSKMNSGRRDSSTMIIKSSREEHRTPAVPSAFPTLNKVNLVPENLTPTIEAIPLDHSRPPTSNATLPPISSDSVADNRRKSRSANRTSINALSLSNPSPATNTNNLMIMNKSVSSSSGSNSETPPQPSPATLVPPPTSNNNNNRANQRLSSKLMSEPVLQGSFPPTKSKITQPPIQPSQSQQPVQSQPQPPQPVKKQQTDPKLLNQQPSKSVNSNPVVVPPIDLSSDNNNKIHEKCMTPQAQPTEPTMEILTPINNNIIDDDFVAPSPIVRGRVPPNFKIVPILKTSNNKSNNNNESDSDSDFEIQLSFDDPNKIKKVKEEKEQKRKEKEMKKKKRVGLKWGDVHIREYKSTICPSSVPQSTGVPVGLSWEMTIEDEATPIEVFEKWKDDQKDRIDVQHYQREGILASMERQWIVQRAGVSREVMTRVQKEVEQTRMQRFRSSNDEITDEEEKKLSASFSSHLTDQLRQIQQLMKEQGIT